MATSNYNSNQVSVEFAGITIGEGRTVEDFVVIEPVTAERNAMFADAEGNVAYGQNNDNRHLVRVKLMQKSEAHALLSAILNGDLTLPGGAGIANFSVIDTNGTSLFVEPEARIQGWPSKAYGQNPDKEMEWVFLCPDPQRFDGGI